MTNLCLLHFQIHRSKEKLFVLFTRPYLLYKWKYKRLKTGAEIVSEAIFQFLYVKKEIRPIQNMGLHYNHLC